MNLQLNIVPAGTPPFLTHIAPGPSFGMTYDVNTPPAPISTGGYNQVVDGLATSGPSKGAIAAAIIIPLIIIAGSITAFMKWSRTKRTQKSKRWSQAVDKRMSTISTDWKSMSGAGANAGIRSSMAIRTSSLFGPDGRPESQFADAGRAGIGMRNQDDLAPQMAQLRQARASTFGQSRTSRISFAENVVVSGGDLRPMQTNTSDRSRYNARSFDEQPDSGVVSPTQAHGAMPLTPDAIRAKLNAAQDEDLDKDLRKDVLQMPAMTRTSPFTIPLLPPH